jgi:tRNA1Val (adenine37-N6)-methyltransferase
MSAANEFLRPGERVCDLQRNGLAVIQSDDGFRFGQDAVLLSDFARAKPGETVLDMCCGCGVIPILMTAKTRGERFFGVEIDAETAERAARSVEMNGLSSKINIIRGDITNMSALFPRRGFHAATCNPPYIPVGAGLKNISPKKAAARHEILCDLRGVIKGASEALRPGGRFYMIHRPKRIGEIFLLAREYRFGVKTLRFVHPKADKPPSSALIELVGGGEPELRVSPPLIVRSEDGSYTDEIRRIYAGRPKGDRVE